MTIYFNNTDKIFKLSNENGENINLDYDVNTTGVDFPAEPILDFTQMAQYEYKNATDEITNALNILRMTDEEVVNASTMKSIAQYL